MHYGPGSPFGANEVRLGSFFLAGDFDENGVVEAADLARWRSNFGIGDTHSDGDADGDHDVDG